MVPPKGESCRVVARLQHAVAGTMIMNGFLAIACATDRSAPARRIWHASSRLSPRGIKRMSSQTRRLKAVMPAMSGMTSEKSLFGRAATRSEIR